MNENILGTKKISKLFLKFCIPAIVSMVIAGIQPIIDGIFLGNFVGTNSMASVNIVQPFMQLIIGFSMIVSVGALSFIGRSLGEGKKEESQNIFKTATIVLFSASILMLLFGKMCSVQIASFLGANEVLLNDCAIYINTISTFAPMMCIMFLFGFISRVLNNPELYLKATISSLITNIILDYLFIKELGLGIGGAAFATGLSFSVALIVVIIPMFNKDNILNIYVGKFDKSLILPMLYNGSSEGVVSVAAAITAFVFNMTFMNIAGEQGVAAFTTINYMGQFVTLIMFGISDGITPIVSYNYGTKNKQRLDEALGLAIKVNVSIGIILFLTLFGFGRPLVSIFANDNQAIIDLATSGSKLYALAFLVCGFNIIYSGYFTAIGNARASITIALSRGIIFIVAGIYLLPMIIGISGVWLTIPFAEVITYIIGINLIKTNNKNYQMVA